MRKYQPECSGSSGMNWVRRSEACARPTTVHEIRMPLNDGWDFMGPTVIQNIINPYYVVCIQARYYILMVSGYTFFHLYYDDNMITYYYICPAWSSVHCDYYNCECFI